MMIGIAGGLSNRVGGYIIPNVINTDNQEKYNLIIPAGSRLLCTNCQIENEDTLNDITKTDTGYYFLNKLEVTIIKDKSNLTPMTILNGREILYADYVENIEGKLVFNLPMGSRINGIEVESVGEITIEKTNKILIEL